MAPSTLRQQCTNAAMRNIKRIDADGFGDAPWELLKPILSKCEDPKMLQAWEEHTPQIRGETGDIWLKFIKRDVPNWRKMPHEPTNPELWCRVYWKLKKQADADERKAEELLKAKMSKIRKEEDEWKVAAPTKAIPERKGRAKGVAMQFLRGSDNNGLRFTTGTKTKDFMQAARRQVAESKLQKTGVLARTTKMLNNAMPAKVIVHAPQHMIEERQRQVDSTRQSRDRLSRGLRASGTAQSTPLAPRAARELKLCEDRLRAAREGGAFLKRTNPTEAKAFSVAKSRLSSNTSPRTSRHQFDGKTTEKGSKSSTSPPAGQLDDLFDHAMPVDSTQPASTSRKDHENACATRPHTSGKQVQEFSRRPKHSSAQCGHNETLNEGQPVDSMRISDLKQIPPPGSANPMPIAKRKAGPSILLPMKHLKR